MRQDGRYILGIHDGHNCGATLTRDGVILASISEERITRNKNEVGYPQHAIEAVMRLGGVEAGELSEVVYASLFMHDRAHLQDITTWYAVGAAEQKADAESRKDYASIIFERRKQDRIAQVSAHLSIAKERVFFVEHHLAHLAAAYYTAPFAGETDTLLGLTCDGAGDNIAATVSVCRKGKFERIAETDRHASLGKIYSRVTFLMGMTPWEHEYKLMGLAPYADPERADQRRRATSAPIEGVRLTDCGSSSARSYRQITPTNICNRPSRAYASTPLPARPSSSPRKCWSNGCKEAIRKTGIRDVVCGGGVFMNVKANMLLAQLPEVRSIYVMPSAADESLSIGACLYRTYINESDGDFSASRLTNLYLGGVDDAKAEEAAIEAARNALQISVERPGDMNAAIADLLANGEIVAVCRGRMEWGARALGNRSILSCAADPRRIDEINNMIKMRDFWMPFAPSIKAESAHRYFKLDKNIEPDFMTFAFPLLPGAAKDLAAGAHPKDRTIRPQMVRKTANPDYHAVIEAFERRTGRGGILNTSFNLHGEPIVMTSSDAVRVLAKSGLRHLALNGHLLSKVLQ